MALVVLHVCLLITVSAAFTAAADSIHGCGGFVVASPELIRSRKPSDGKLDYSHITVELRTVDGLVKDRTHCAPNGYYFIPVYDKGSMIVKVKGPDGWTWKPENVPVLVDQDGCNSNLDINFQFTGFTISGSVKGAVGGKSCSSKDSGPSNVKVELLISSDEVISSALTSSLGVYTFTNITPGTYKLHASHPNLRIEVRGSPEVELGFGNAIVGDIFFVSGYDIRGLVVAQGNPILGVHIYLYSDDISEIHCPQGVGDSPTQRGALCHTISDADGKFIFRSIPCGVYQLIPYYKGENTVFDVSPASVVVAVEHRHVTIPQKFQVTGFSIGGRIIDGNGKGVDNVKIIVDGQHKATSDGQGFYKLDQVTSKHYSIHAFKEHYNFESLENFLVLPNLTSINDIKAVLYDLCGSVHLVSSGSKVKVVLTHARDGIIAQTELVDKFGKFCFQVPEGGYQLSALPVERDSSPDLLFSPPYISVTINSPVLNVEFFQAQVNVHGNVICKEGCDPSVVVSLSRLIGGVVEDETVVSINYENGGFLFSKVSSGSYQLEVKRNSLSGTNEDDWCWDQRIINFDVAAEDVKGIVFVQKGYWISVTSSHDADAYIQHLDSTTRVDFSIKTGSQKICVESSGDHELHFSNQCVLFGSSSVQFNTLRPSPIFLTGVKYLVRGELHIDPIVHFDSFDLSQRIVLDIATGDGRIRESIPSLCGSDVKSQTNKIVCEYSFWSQLSEDFIFIPRDSSHVNAKRILFYPQLLHVSVNKDGCQDSILPIIGRFGLYIKGAVTPGVSGVDIKIYASRDDSNPAKMGDLAMETMTEEDGSFVAGPLYDDINYVVEASKPGYHIKKTGPYTFTCQELGEILVNIRVDGEFEELFPPVLLSLSGEDGYRNNSVSGVGGTYIFSDLFPGSFYLRPLLKEYSFSPATVAIELGSGESKVVVFQATRVAYSAMGTISLLSGLPKDGVYIEARSESSGYYEEAITDHLGHFRLRGLLPDAKYLVRLAAKEYPGGLGIERATPESFELEVGSEDIRGLNFVVFERPEITILSGHVDGVGLNSLQPHLSVEVKSAGDPSKIESVFPLPLSCYFEVRDLPKGKHLVQLLSGLPSSIHRFESDIVEVDLGKQPQIHVGPIKFRIEEHHHRVEPTPAPVFPLIVGVLVIALFIGMPRLKDLYEFAVGRSPSGSSPSPAAGAAATAAKKDARKPVLRKRTY